MCDSPFRGGAAVISDVEFARSASTSLEAAVDAAGSTCGGGAERTAVQSVTVEGLLSITSSIHDARSASVDMAVKSGFTAPVLIEFSHVAVQEFGSGLWVM